MTATIARPAVSCAVISRPCNASKEIISRALALTPQVKQLILSSNSLVLLMLANSGIALSTPEIRVIAVISS
jgi:hypothetical protein